MPIPPATTHSPLRPGPERPGRASEEAETLYGLLWPADTINPLVEVLPPANSNSDHYHPAEHAARHMLGRERMGE